MNATEPFVKCYFAIPPWNYCFSRGGAEEEQNMEMGMVLLCSLLRLLVK